MTTLQDELTRLLNCYSCENGSDTPDYILAHYLQQCLHAFDTAVKHREAWYGRVPKPLETNQDVGIPGDGSSINGS